MLKFIRFQTIINLIKFLLFLHLIIKLNVIILKFVIDINYHDPLVFKAILIFHPIITNFLILNFQNLLLTLSNSMFFFKFRSTYPDFILIFHFILTVIIHLNFINSTHFIIINFTDLL